MAVAIITAEIMHSSPVCSVRFFQTLIVPGDIIFVDMKLYVFGSFTESEVINANEVWSSKVVDLSVRVCDSGMTNARDQPCNEGNWSPSDTQRESSLIAIQFF